jgi:hypothetical protein
MLLSLHTPFNYDGNKSKLKTMGKSNAKRAEAVNFGWYGGKYSHLDWLLLDDRFNRVGIMGVQRGLNKL